MYNAWASGYMFSPAGTQDRRRRRSPPRALTTSHTNFTRARALFAAQILHHQLGRLSHSQQPTTMWRTSLTTPRSSSCQIG